MEVQTINLRLVSVQQTAR